MKNRKSLWLNVAAFTLVLSSCGMKYVDHSEVVRDHLGQPIKSLISEYGSPRQTNKLPNDEMVYLFITSKQVKQETKEIQRQSFYEHGSYSQGSYPTRRESYRVYETVTKRCEISATTDKAGTIIDISSRGDGCDGKWIKG